MGRGEGPEGTLLIYDHWGEYTPQYTTARIVSYRIVSLLFIYGDRVTNCAPVNPRFY